MSYQVLARKWRPRTFADTVGQRHVRRALANALDSGRLHHAYLFSGTRGVGKTTLARVFAKALNCEEGVSAEPCGVCSACREIDEGRFVDLIEVDAASRTRVDDTRELLENVQYAPSRGRFKVYLIDEVHMLSTHSFNALLKTLEEPPEHVKFLLATTDPQKLPVTVLSRCLQFNLKRIDPDEIRERMAHILDAEAVAYDGAALDLLADAAAGSLRDGLSLLDQAIAYGAGEVREAATREILGTVDQREIAELLGALAANDAAQLFSVIDRIDEHGPDYGRLLGELASTVQRAAVQRALGSAMPGDTDVIGQAARDFAAEDLQLAYQMLINGIRDLNLAPQPRSGFEMTLLRILAFRPASSGTDAAGNDAGGSRATTVRVPASAVEAPNTTLANSAPPASPPPRHASLPAEIDWFRLVPELALSGVDRMLASNCALESVDGERITLSLDQRSAAQYTDERRSQIERALATHFGASIQLAINRTGGAETPAQRDVRLADEHRLAAEQAIRQDPNVKALMTLFDAEIDSDSIVVHTTAGDATQRSGAKA